MRRPLLVVAFCLVVITAIRLKMGWLDRVRPGCITFEQIEASDTLCVTGQVYQKNEDSITLRSVILLQSDAFGQSAGDFRQEISCQENLICETEDAEKIPLGSTVVLEGIFTPFSHAGNPGEFDAFYYYRTLKIGGKLKKAHILQQGEDYWPLRESLYVQKCSLKGRLYQIFPEKEAAVMSALLLGEKDELDSELKDMYRRNGILHIFSISSLHISIIGMAVYKLLRRLGAPICVSAAVGSILLLCYGCMTGFGVSACRAIGMYLLKMFSEIAGRTYDMLTALGCMAIVMVAGNPYYLENSGFLLSFASVLGIGVLYPILLPEKRNPAFSLSASTVQKAAQKIGASLRQGFFASLSITLATLPIQLWFYYEIPTYSVFLNLFVIPFLKPLMISGILAMIVPGLGWAGALDRLILGGYEFACRSFDSLPFSIWNPGCPGWWQIGLYYLLLAGGAFMLQQGKRKRNKSGKTRGAREKMDPRSMGQRKLRPLAPTTLLCAAIGVLGLPPVPANSVTFLDVGQGDCILLRTASGQAYLFDCGSSNRKNVGKYVLLPYLKYNGIHTLDGVFLSHPDEDHVNGALELLEMGEESGIFVRQLVLPGIEEGSRQEQLGELLGAAGNNLPVGYLSAGDCWSCGSADFTCLHPQEGVAAEESNVYSECIFAEFKETGFAVGQMTEWSLLLTGDVEGKGEDALYKELLERKISKVTVLKVAHHGSRNSTQTKLLEQISPLLAVISCGVDNRYGHPHAQLLERLEDSGAYIAQTSQSGAITVTFRKGSLRIARYHERQ